MFATIAKYIPGLKVFQSYQRDWFQADLVAGVSVAAVALPVGIAYAQLAGLPPVVGIYWQLSHFQHGLTVSMALIGTIGGALLGSIPSERLGRRKTLSYIAAFYLLSAVGTALVQNCWVFLMFRFMGCLGVGAS